jgi:hypothetical protein
VVLVCLRWVVSPSHESAQVASSLAPCLRWDDFHPGPLTKSQESEEKEPETQPTEEEDEQARKQRIAAKLASMGGCGLG